MLDPARLMLGLYGLETRVGSFRAAWDRVLDLAGIRHILADLCGCFLLLHRDPYVPGQHLFATRQRGLAGQGQGLN